MPFDAVVGAAEVKLATLVLTHVAKVHSRDSRMYPECLIFHNFQKENMVF